jgi:hypothetical protein
VDAASGTIDRDVAMQMRRRGDGYRVNALTHQVCGVPECSAAQRASNLIAAVTIGVGDADQPYSWKFRQNPGVITAHDADADHADA